ncbi:hypothetical protein TrVFT333_000903 [Trichoderma virens FT-333]|nr:hypothetical protein TrVFT333_000903 [Trichoderma virens FT-333]
MDGIESENAKAANQSWRKKPRKFAPKSRLGCRTCDGFSETPLAPKTEIESSHYYYNEKTSRAESCGSYHPCTAIVPAVRYAAIALALINRIHMDRHSSDRVQQPQSREDWLPDEAPLFYYNRAIQLLLNQEIGESSELTAITLLVCYLFICFDHLSSNYVQALKHLRGGVELSRNLDKAILNESNTYDDAKPSEAHTLIRQVVRQIRRLDLQAVTFLTDWTPADIQETLVSQLPPYESAFQSLDQAADHLEILVARVMELRNTEQQTSQTGRCRRYPQQLI